MRPIPISELADWAGIVGFFLSILGFIVTIVGVYRSKSAAERAEEAAVSTRAAVVRISAVEDVAAAVSEMEEIKRLHRASAWPILPDRYATLRRRLASIKSADLSLTDEQLAILQNAIQHFADIEARVERSLTTGAKPPSVARMNTVVSDQVDQLHQVLIALKGRF